LQENATEHNRRGFYYGYVIVIVSAFIMMAGWGTYFSYGLFFESLLNEFDWSRAVTAGAYSVSTFISGFLGIIGGRLSDRVGPKAVCIFCAACFGIGFLLMALVNSAWQVYVIYGLPLAIGIGGLWPPMISTVARWFTGNRGLMTGLVAAGIGVGAVILSPLISYFISTYGWRNAYVIIGILALLVITISALFLKRDPGQMGLVPHGVKTVKKESGSAAKDLSFQYAIRTRPFWIIALVYFLFGYSQITMMVHIVPYATGLGIAHLQAASILAVIGATSIIGRIGFGIICDRIRVKSSLIITLIIFFLAVLWLQFAEQLWALYLFAIVFGFAWGGLSTLQSLAAAELFGLTSLGVIVGNFSFSFCFGGLFGPIVSGYIYDVSGSYKLAFLICSIAALTALIAVMWLTIAKKERETF
jgi:MFS family permease